LFGHDFHHFQVENLYAIISHTAWQTLSFNYAGSKRRITHRPRCAKPVMLTVRLASNTGKTVPFYNTLESFTF